MEIDLDMLTERHAKILQVFSRKKCIALTLLLLVEFDDTEIALVTGLTSPGLFLSMSSPLRPSFSPPDPDGGSRLSPRCRLVT